jgi:hypothetical protein
MCKGGDNMNLNKVLMGLTRLSGINYQAQDWQKLIADVKASDADEATQNEIISVAQKAIDAETKRNTAVVALLEKYSKSENIAASEPEDDDFY